MTRDFVSEELHKQTEAALELIRALADHEDSDLNADMVEAETTLFEAVAKAIAEIDECEIMMNGLDDKIGALRERWARFKVRADKIRVHIERAMTITDIQTIKLDVATVTVRAVAPKPIVEQEADIPSEYWRTPDPVLDKAKINADVKSGVTIPGVTMDNGGVSLTIRRK